MRIFNNIKNGVMNLCKWSKIIWNDRDWDYIFLLDLLLFKLNNMEKSIRKSGYGINTNETADSIHKAIIPLKRIIEDNYGEDLHKNHDEKWEESEIEFSGTCIKASMEEYKLLTIKRPNVKTKKDEKQERKEFIDIVEKANNMEAQDYNLLFDYMKEYIREWWD